MAREIKRGDNKPGRGDIVKDKYSISGRHTVLLSWLRMSPYQGPGVHRQANQLSTTIESGLISCSIYMYTGPRGTNEHLITSSLH